MHPYRTHTCGELRADHDGKDVRLSGWVFRKRDHGSLLFIDLRDHYGVTQVVVQPDSPFFEACQRLRLESVITVTGTVALRSRDTVNPALATGEVELRAKSVEVQSAAEPLPFQIASDEEAPEDLRLKYRFLDLRRERMRRNVLLRSSVIAEMRRIMTHQHGFVEFQTPILTSSSPEGARDYLVPSRVHPGKFYALPQSPQQFKQLLMVAGFDRYFQIAPCFRDEDARADRSPGEHYQLDIEMSFATQDDVFGVVESVMHSVFTKFSSAGVTPPPFPRISYADALATYGTDKPDLRNPLKMIEVSEVFRDSEFRAFRSCVEKKGVVRAIPVKGIAGQPRSFFDRMEDFARSLGAKGLGYIIWDDAGPKGPIAKFLKEGEIAELVRLCGTGEGDVVFFLADNPKLVNKVGGEVRTRLGKELNLFEQNVFRFCWVVDFPMYEFDEEQQAIMFSHNPFSMPQGGIQALEEKDPLQVLAWQYDIVCNGIELASGAVRNHRPDIMYKAFEIAGYTKETVDTRFPALITAFRLGAPPHAGIAPGVDRIVMMLAGEENIREVVAFPMNQKAQDLMMNAPSEVTPKQLRELHIRVELPKKAAAVAGSDSRLQDKNAASAS